MCNKAHNAKVNRQLDAMYENHKAAFLEAANEKDGLFTRYGIIDEGVYDPQKGVLLIGKETNELTVGSSHSGEVDFRAWLGEIIANPASHKGETRAQSLFPGTWYQAGR